MDPSGLQYGQAQGFGQMHGPPPHMPVHYYPVPPGMQAPPAAMQQHMQPQAQPPQPGGANLNVDDALGYLEEVKREFKDDDNIYNRFLEIMKNFKAQTLTTPGVIRKVSELFHGHPDLIFKFNRFLPPGFRIDAAEDYTGMPDGSPAMTGMPGGAMMAGMPHAGIPPAASQVALPPPPARRPVAPVRAEGKPPEFDHAIQYVTKIKQRFVKDQPDVYKRFLEILHAYQKSSLAVTDQSAVINEVLSNVASLFQDHPDLLRDFRFFLPDTVQDMAHERLQQIIAQQQYARSRGAPGVEAERMAHAGAHMQYAASAEYGAHPGSRALADERLYQSHLHRASMGMGPGRSERGAAIAAAARDVQGRLHPQVSTSEAAFFHRLKVAVGGREVWVEVLKTLDLSARGVLSRSELLALLDGVVPAPLLEELKALMLTKGAVEVTATDAFYTLPVADLDFKGCRRCTPSYRCLPDGYPQLRCSERAPWEQRVLNDKWVSIQTGSEDYSFKHMRRNTYEEALFRCEDERYEVDMVIDTNASAVRILEPLAQEINTLKAAKGFQWRFLLDRRALGVVHLKAIARVYGDRGEEMLELLRKNPGGAVPVILRRLREKDTEWRLARRKHNERWRKVMADNYHRSLDHRSFYFRQHDKRAIAAKSLIKEMKDVVDAAEAEVRGWRERRERAMRGEIVEVDEAAVAAGKPPSAAGKGATGSVRYTRDGRAIIEPTLLMRYEDTGVFRDAADLIARGVERFVHDKVRAAGVWHGFCARFLRMEAPPRESPLGAATPSGDGLPTVGDVVDTPYGPGVVAALRWGNHGVLDEDADAPRRARAAASAVGGQDSSASSSAAAAADPAAGENSPAAPPAAPDVMARIRLIRYSQGYVVLPAKKLVLRNPPELQRVRAGITGGTGGGGGSLVAGGGVASGSSTHPGVGGRVLPMVPDLPAPPQAADAPEAAPSEATGLSVARGSKRGGRKPRKGGALPPPPVSRLPESERGEDEDIAASDDVPGDVDGMPPPAGSVFLGTAGDFVFFRLHQMMCERLALARRLARRPTRTAGHVLDREAAASSSSSSSAGAAQGSAAGTSASAATLGGGEAEAEGERRYRLFLSALHSLVQGETDERAYEDECRELLGSGAYAVFTLDRMAQHAARQLGVLAGDEASAAARAVYERHLLNLDVVAARAALSSQPADAAALEAMAAEACEQYRLDAASLLRQHSEDWYMIQFAPDSMATEAIGAAFAERTRARVAASLGLAEDDAAPPQQPSSVASNGALGKDPVAAMPRGAAGSAPAGVAGASLSIRFVGTPADDAPSDRIAADLPAYAARLLTHGTLMRGALPPSALAEEQAAAEAAEAAAEQAEASGVVLARNVRAGASSSSSSSAGAADAGQRGVVRAGAVVASVTAGEGLAPAAGGTEAMAAVRQARKRQREDGEAERGAAALGQWADAKVSEMGAPPATEDDA